MKKSFQYFIIYSFLLGTIFYETSIFANLNDALPKKIEVEFICAESLRPVAGVTLKQSQVGKNKSQRPPKSQSDGIITLRDEEIQKEIYFVSPDTHVDIRFTYPDDKRQISKRLKILVPKAKTFSGRIVKHDGSPLANSKLSVSCYNLNDQPNVEYFAKDDILTDAEGRFKIRKCFDNAEGLYINLNTPNELDEYLEISFILQEGREKLNQLLDGSFIWQLPPSVTISLKVFNNKGKILQDYGAYITYKLPAEKHVSSTLLVNPKKDTIFQVHVGAELYILIKYEDRISKDKFTHNFHQEKIGTITEPVNLEIKLPELKKTSITLKEGDNILKNVTCVVDFASPDEIFFNQDFELLADSHGKINFFLTEGTQVYVSSNMNGLKFEKKMISAGESITVTYQPRSDEIIRKDIFLEESSLSDGEKE